MLSNCADVCYMFFAKKFMYMNDEKGPPTTTVANKVCVLLVFIAGIIVAVITTIISTYFNKHFDDISGMHYYLLSINYSLWLISLVFYL